MLPVGQHRCLIRVGDQVLLVELRLALVSWLRQIEIAYSSWRLGASILGDLLDMSWHRVKLRLQIFRNLFEDDELKRLLLFHRRLRNCLSQIGHRLCLLNGWQKIAALASCTAWHVYLGLVVQGSVLSMTLIRRGVGRLMLVQSDGRVILILGKSAGGLLRLKHLESVLLG